MARRFRTETLRHPLGMRIRELRKEQNLSQAKFALMIGLDRSYINEIEQGKRNISIDNISRIIAGLDITPAEFFAPMSSKIECIEYSSEEF